jgi:hypothetical protein
MSFEGADPGIVGASYQAPMPLQDAQLCINWFVEIDKNQRAKMPMALLAAPGLQPLFNTQVGPVRGAWVLPGGQTALFVTGNKAYLATISVQASQTTSAQFSVREVGTLLTNTGRVVIRDNGALFNGLGGYAVLVDGPYGYFFRLSGATTMSFTGNLTSTSPTITYPVGQLVPNYLIIGSGTTLSDSGGGLSTGTLLTEVSYTANTISLSQQANATITNDTFFLSIPEFGQITDPAFLGSSRLSFIEGWLIFNEPNTRTFYTNAPFPYTLTFAGSFYALKDSSSDNLVTQMENSREWWAIGERTTEVWNNTGGANFAFSRLPGVGPQIGCSAVHSIARFGPNLAWLASNENGQNIVVMTEQYSYTRISNHAVENAISSYPYIADAIGDCYEELGHVQYVLTFPTADVTWVYDLSSEMWWQRLSWNQGQGAYHRHRGNCFVNFGNQSLWGDYQTGQVHQQSRKIYTDAGQPLRALRRSPHIWSREDRKRISHASLQVEFGPGVGTQTGQGSNPQTMIRWSEDSGETWSNEHYVPIGKVGETRNRAIVRRLGKSRDRIYEVSYTDPTPRDIIGATLFGEGEDAQE